MDVAFDRGDDELAAALSGSFGRNEIGGSEVWVTVGRARGLAMRRGRGNRNAQVL